jgi:hypothetical protein
MVLLDRVPLDSQFAVCTDGSPASYYWRAASSAGAETTWLVYLEGGGWCWDTATCDTRCAANPSRCGSATWAETWPSRALSVFPHGLFDAQDARIADANMVLLRYCTSDAHMGNVSVVDGAPPALPRVRQHRGAAVVRAMIADLRAKGMGAAGPRKHLLLFGGGSAGARGAMVHLDAIASELPSMDVVGFLDSPVWVETGPAPASCRGPYCVGCL